MSSTSFAFSSDFEASSSSDPLLLSSRLAVSRNPDSLPASDMGLSAQSSSHDVNRFFHSPDISRSQPAPMYPNSSVSSLHHLYSFVCTPQKQSMSLQPSPIASMGPYDPAIPRANNVFEEYIKMRTERDAWHTMYNELRYFFFFPGRIYAIICVYFFVICYANVIPNISRTTHDNMVKCISENIATLSSGFKNVSSQVDTLLTTSESKPLVTPTDQAIHSSSSDVSVSSLGRPQKILFDKALPPQLKRADHPNVRFWFPDDYHSLRKSGKADEGESIKDGSKLSVLSRYMEDERGEVVPDTTKNAARAHAKGIFMQFLLADRAPAKWGDAPQDVINELIYSLETTFPWLQLCEDHWKAKQIATNSYSQWLPGALVRVKADKAKTRAGLLLSETEVIDVDAVEPRRKRPLKRRVVDDDGAGPSKRPHLEEASSGAQPDKPATNRRQVRIIYCWHYYTHR